MTEIKLPFFSRGEISPKMLGRVDTAAYQSGLKTAQNAIVDVMGGIMNRPGTVFITTAKYNDEDKVTRLIPFAFNTTDTHMLEVGHEYIRIIREDFPQLSLNEQLISTIAINSTTGQVTVVGPAVAEGSEVYIEGVVGTTQINDQTFIASDSSGASFKLKSRFSGDYVDGRTFTPYVSGGTVDTIYEIATPYQAEHIRGIRFAQSADVMFLVHTLYPPMELRRFGLADWELVESEFNPVGSFPTDITATPASESDQIVEYQVTSIDSNGKESLPGLGTESYTITAMSKTNPVHVEVDSTVNFQEFDPIYIDGVVGMTDVNGRRFTVVNVSGTGFDLKNTDGTSYGTYTSGGRSVATFFRLSTSASTPDNTIGWTGTDDAELYAVYKAENGVYGFIGETRNLSFRDDNIDADATQQPPQLVNFFQKPGDYPGAIGFYQQRKVLGGSLNAPDSWYASVPGDYNNYVQSTPTQDDDAIQMTLTSGQINQIGHFLTADNLNVFTGGQEWNINSGGDVAFSPLTVKQSTSTNWGINEHRPFMVGGTIVFIQQDNRTVRSYTYDQVYNTSKSANLSLLSSHLFDTNQVVDWALARTPYSAMVLTRDDGNAAIMVYNEEQNVIGWTWWDTQGKFESVGVTRICLEPNTAEPDDGIYFTVRRQTANGWVRFIERLHNRRLPDVRDAFFVDCGMSFDDPKCITDISPNADGELVITAANHGFSDNNPVDFTGIVWSGIQDSNGNLVQPDQLNDTKFIAFNCTTNTFQIKTMDLDEDVITTSTWPTYYRYFSGGQARLNMSSVTGLDHLDGMFVSVLADGYPLRGQVVTNGTVLLPGLASRIHVGLSYRTDIETLNIEPQLGSNTIQGRPKRIHKMWIRVNNSREFMVGYDKNNFNPMKRVPFQEGFVGLAPILYSGDREVTMPPGWNGDGRMFFRMLDPLPFSIIGLFPEFSVS